MRSSSFDKIIEVVFHFQKYYCFYFYFLFVRLFCFRSTSIFQKKMRSSSFFKNIIVFTFNCFWLLYFVSGCLPFSKKRKSTSFNKKFEVAFHFQNIEVVFHISSSWVKIRLHTKNQLPRLPGTVRIVITSVVVWWWVFYR
jgi:hypothetical protein